MIKVWKSGKIDHKTVWCEVHQGWRPSAGGRCLQCIKKAKVARRKALKEKEEQEG